jgi:hypothetical protein
MCQLLEARGGTRVVVSVLSDMDGVTRLKRGEADYYFGACLSGAGGALAMATALLGPTIAVRVSGLGTAPDAASIAAQIAGGARAFGLAAAHIDVVVPMVLDEILERELP